MRHVILTCKNHPDLRWSCKECAVNADGSYNGTHNIFFGGKAYSPPRFYSDMSGVRTEYAAECDCSPRDLTFAPEDAEVKKAYEEGLI